MRVALMQPYLFPYLGYFQLIAAADRFVTFDTAQYLRRGWMHRNRVLDADGGWQWLGLPVVKAPRDTPVHAMRVNREIDLLGRFEDALRPYRERAPFVDVVEDLVRRWCAIDDDSFTTVVEGGLTLVCDLLGLRFAPIRATTLGLTRAEDDPVSSWAVAACRELDATSYVNAPGGRELYPAADFHDAALGLAFVEPTLPTYDRAGLSFEPGLSILDVIAFAGPAATAAMIDQASLDIVVDAP